MSVNRKKETPPADPGVLFVAEVSSNHNRDLDRCFAFIDKASQIGCDAVKFQHFKVAELFAPEILARSREHRRRKAWELPPAFLPAIAQRCASRRVQFACTPFSLEAVEALLPYVDFYKIASYELLWGDLLEACARTGKPMVLSTGMATMDEVRRSVALLDRAGCIDVTLLHCVSSYPAAPDECNLAAIASMRLACHRPVGWSDHSLSPAVVHRAVHRWGACMVEFHMDLDGRGKEFGFGHCWLPDDARRVMETVRSGFAADGNGEKAPMWSELPDRKWRADPGDGLRPMRKTREAWRR